MPYVVIASRKTRIARIHRDECSVVNRLSPGDQSGAVTRDQVATLDEAVAKGSERARSFRGVKRMCGTCLPDSN